MNLFKNFIGKGRDIHSKISEGSEKIKSTVKTAVFAALLWYWAQASWAGMQEKVDNIEEKNNIEQSDTIFLENLFKKNNDISFTTWLDWDGFSVLFDNNKCAVQTALYWWGGGSLWWACTFWESLTTGVSVSSQEEGDYYSLKAIYSKNISDVLSAWVYVEWIKLDGENYLDANSFGAWLNFHYDATKNFNFFGSLGGNLTKYNWINEKQKNTSYSLGGSYIINDNTRVSANYNNVDWDESWRLSVTFSDWCNSVKDKNIFERIVQEQNRVNAININKDKVKKIKVQEITTETTNNNEESSWEAIDTVPAAIPEVQVSATEWSEYIESWLGTTYMIADNIPEAYTAIEVSIDSKDHYLALEGNKDTKPKPTSITILFEPKWNWETTTQTVEIRDKKTNKKLDSKTYTVEWASL